MSANPKVTIELPVDYLVTLAVTSEVPRSVARLVEKQLIDKGYGDLVRDGMRKHLAGLAAKIDAIMPGTTEKLQGMIRSTVEAIGKGKQ